MRNRILSAALLQVDRAEVVQRLLQLDVGAGELTLERRLGDLVQGRHGIVDVTLHVQQTTLPEQRGPVVGLDAKDLPVLLERVV